MEGKLSSGCMCACVDKPLDLQVQQNVIWFSTQRLICHHSFCHPSSTFSAGRADSDWAGCVHYGIMSSVKKECNGGRSFFFLFSFHCLNTSRSPSSAFYCISACVSCSEGRWKLHARMSPLCLTIVAFSLICCWNKKWNRWIPRAASWRRHQMHAAQ